MTEDNLSDEERAQRAYNEVTAGETDYDTIFRLPASEDYPFGDEVGFIEYDGWLMAVEWANGEVCGGRYAIDKGGGAPFPSHTKWMITDNSAIDHGLTSEEEA